jgi:hypothetical protein
VKRNLHVAGVESQHFSPAAGQENSLLLPPGWENSASKRNNDGYLVLCKGLKVIGTRCTKVYTFDFFYLEDGGLVASAQLERVLVLYQGIWGTQTCCTFRPGLLEGHHAVNAICPEDAELALVITAKVDEAATTLSGAG